MQALTKHGFAPTIIDGTAAYVRRSDDGEIEEILTLDQGLCQVRSRSLLDDQGQHAQWDSGRYRSYGGVETATLDRVLELLDDDRNEYELLELRIANDDGDAPPCPECVRSFGPHYRGRCTH